MECSVLRRIFSRIKEMLDGISISLVLWWVLERLEGDSPWLFVFCKCVLLVCISVVSIVWLARTGERPDWLDEDSNGWLWLNAISAPFEGKVFAVWSTGFIMFPLIAKNFYWPAFYGYFDFIFFYYYLRFLIPPLLSVLCSTSLINVDTDKETIPKIKYKLTRLN